MKDFFKKHWFPTLWISVTLILYFIVLLTSKEIQSYNIILTAKGLTHFVNVFRIPIYFLAAGIPFWGIVLTIQRITQTDEQLKVVQDQYLQGKLQSIENTFFKLIDMYVKFVRSLKFYTGGGWVNGKEVFNHLHYEFHGQFHKKKLDDVNKFSEFYNGYMKNKAEKDSIYLEQYFNLIEGIFTHIEKHEDIIEIKTFVNVLKSQFSKYELLFILYYSILPSNLKFHKKIKKYEILTSVNITAALSYNGFDTWKIFSNIHS